MPQDWVDDEVNLLDYWRVIRKRGWIILGLVFPLVFTTGFYSYFIATKIYESKAAILAPKESGGGGASGLAALITATSSGQSSGGSGGLGGVFNSLVSGGGSNRDAFIAILKSRTMAEDIVSRFRLKEYYKEKFTEDAIKALREVTDISVSKEGVISVRVEDKDPKLAADIANAYVTSLDRLFAKLGTTDASRQRTFVAERLEKTEKALRQAEEALRRFQETNKAIVLTEQSKSTIEAAARARGELAAAEVQLEVMRTFATENNPQLLQQKRQVEGMKRQLAQMEYGREAAIPSEKGGEGQDRRDFQVPFAKVPALGMELIRLTREVKVQESVFSLLTAQYEQAKISEARDTPVVQVLDKAIPSERKSKPKTTLNIAMVGVLSLFIGVFLAFFLEYLERIRGQKPIAV